VFAAARTMVGIADRIAGLLRRIYPKRSYIHATFSIHKSQYSPTSGRFPRPQGIFHNQFPRCMANIQLLGS
jgi:hypothetical protein